MRIWARSRRIVLRFRRRGLNRGLLPEAMSNSRKASEPLLDQSVDRARRVAAIGQTLARTSSSQQGYAIVSRRDWIDREAACRAGIDHILAQHQVLDIGIGNSNALLSGQASRATNIE